MFLNHLRYTEITPVVPLALAGPWANPNRQPFQTTWPAYSGGFSAAKPANTSSLLPDLPHAKDDSAQGPKKTGWDYLAKTSLGAVAVMCSLVAAAPRITKGVQWGLSRELYQTFLNKQPQTSAWHGLHRFLKTQVANEDYLLTALNKISQIPEMLQLNTGYQVGINTQQPSKSLSSLMGTLSKAYTFKHTIPFGMSLSYLSSFFWFSGETNDIKNNNNPGQRKEWDQKRLWQALKGDHSKGAQGFGQEAKTMLKFMGGDYKYTLSLAPWKNLFQSFRNKQDWGRPQPYQTAIGAQLNFVSFFMAGVGYLFDAWEKAGVKTPPQAPTPPTTGLLRFFYQKPDDNQFGKKLRQRLKPLSDWLEQEGFVVNTFGKAQARYLKIMNRWNAAINREAASKTSGGRWGAKALRFAWRNLLPNFISEIKPAQAGAKTAALDGVQALAWSRRFKNVTQLTMAFSIVSYLPVLIRAWQNKTEAESILTILGVPMITARQMQIADPKFNRWLGLFGLGSPIVNEGKRINSQKYRAQVEYLQSLHDKAKANPDITARAMLSAMQSNPNHLKNLALTMGQFRVDFILKTLAEGVRRQEVERISLADYLLPIIKLGA